MPLILRRCALLLVLPLVIAAGGRLSDVWPQPSVGYSADFDMKAGDEDITGKVYAEPGRQRQDFTVKSFDASSVVDFEAEKVLTWSAAFPVVMEVDLGEAAESGLDPRMLEYETLEMEPVGSERIDGVETVKHRIEGRQADGASFDGFVWLTEENIPMRLTGGGRHPEHGTTTIELRLSNLEIGDQDADLFSPPGNAPTMNVGGMLKSLEGALGGLGGAQ